MIAENIIDMDFNNIIFCDPIKNSIIQHSFFYKLIYSNNFLSLNGVFALFNLRNIKINRDKIYFDYNNKETIDKIINLEYQILKLLNTNKNKVYKIKEILENNCFKFSNNDIVIDEINYAKNLNTNVKENNSFFIVKISGIWETKENYGVTFKFILINKFIDFYPSVEKNANKI
tara:strand:- start:2866 stop:3387 length:522 start_codon:yes stop_codon:yes gene_type:complete